MTGFTRFEVEIVAIDKVPTTYCGTGGAPRPN